MSTSNVGLGVPFPKMLPITGTWAVPMTLYTVFLSSRVVYYRLTTKTFLGDKAANAGADEPVEQTTLYRAIRSMDNYLETAPMVVALAGLLELNGANKKSLNYAMALYFLSRLAHAEAGLMANARGMALGRPIGYYGTQLFMVSGALWLVNLTKGYWGF